ncbi:zinc metalloprotease HtpX [Candidatus Poribacteria bacterium]|nr:zinc metalloprotease HtpX [Candidatus Poribacteria bacterium]
MNTIKTGMLMVLLTVLLVLIGSFWGQEGAIFAFAFAIILNFGTYWFSDKIVLSMYRAKEVDPQQAPELYRTVENLSKRAGLPMPRVYIISSDTPNAFATGRNPKNAVIAVTTGLLRALDQDEVKGVLAHELSHIKHRDTLISTIAAAMAGAITMLASMARWAAIFGGFGGGDDDDGGNILGLLFMAILAPLAALMVQMAISRSREYAADKSGAEISGSPNGLANALRRMEAAVQHRPLNANPSTAHMFIVNPLKQSFVTTLFSTHPPIQKRVARLEAMSSER